LLFFRKSNLFVYILLVSYKESISKSFAIIIYPPVFF
jgi:hypothetical protein